MASPSEYLDQDSYAEQLEFATNIIGLLGDPAYQRMVAAQKSWAAALADQVVRWSDFTAAGRDELAHLVIRLQEANQLVRMLEKEPSFIVEEIKRMIEDGKNGKPK